MKGTVMTAALRTRFFCMIALSFIIPAWVAPAVRAADGCVTTQCHTRLLKAKVLHPVAEACDSCHQASATPHPQKKGKTFTLVQKVPQLCEQCHPPFGSMKGVHPPVKDGACTTCHDPHASNEPKLLPQPMKELCLMCHPDILKYKNQHGPAATGDCTACHAPHEAKGKSLLLKEGEQLCFLCHVDMQGELKKKVIHPAIQQGCTSCHNPHSSPARKLLAEEGEKLCFQCHPQIGEKLQKAKTVHKPVKSERSCASCHAPHASDGEKLLPKSGRDLCLDCHRSVILKDQTVLHGPIAKGACTPCHDPHGSAYPRLLTNAYPEDFYVSYSDAEFALCFTCHNRDMLRNPTTTYATGFRDGDRNLHFLHVNKREKGRSCKSCHLVHASALPKLIAQTAPFGKWSLPIRFTKTETGGSCAPGCHQKYDYDRKKAGKAAEQPASSKDRKGK
jgi:predicted CXXCH cytochrome family protein